MKRKTDKKFLKSLGKSIRQIRMKEKMPIVSIKYCGCSIGRGFVLHNSEVRLQLQKVIYQPIFQTMNHCLKEVLKRLFLP